MSAPAVFTARHVQFARAALAAIAALMITFSADHSAPFGLSVFSGFAIATALVLFLAAWLVAASGQRLHYVLLAVIAVIPGLLAGLPALRSETALFVLVLVWAVSCGIVEVIFGLRARRVGDPTARDAITVGIFCLLLGAALLLVPWAFSWEYTIKDVGDFTLTGIILGVGAFGAWAWITAVYLAIAAFTPRRVPVQSDAPTDDAKERRGAV